MTDLNKYHHQGGSDVMLERQHQIDLGYDLNHDAKHHSPESLLQAGACYLDASIDLTEYKTSHPFWPNGFGEYNPEDTQVGNAVKGAAFVMAALDLIHAQSISPVDKEVDEQGE